MNNIKIPLSFTRKYGLFITDSDVVMVSWKGGSLERIAVFSNDEDGVRRFFEFLTKNEKEYKNCGFQIVTNVIGEDYRVEKVAHLIGKYKTDFHRRRMSQLFRDSSLCLSVVQGREERGRREDIVLFYGILTENKILPWMNVIAKGGDRYLIGVYGVSFINTLLLSSVADKWKDGNQLLMSIHEHGLLRQTQYANGKIRFSRVSKINDESVEEVASALKKELERTVQYLGSMKISIAKGINVHFVCPGNMIGQLREMVGGSEKIRFQFHDAATVAQRVGLKAAIGELGRDCSLPLHLMFSSLQLSQLAKIERVRYYWMRAVANAASFAFIVYGLYASSDSAGRFLESRDFEGQRQDLQAEVDERRSVYQSESQIKDPPSIPAHVSSVAQTFRLMGSIQVVPSQLMYYLATGLEKNKRLAIGEIRWYLGDEAATEGTPLALVGGEDMYQNVEISGQLLPIANENYLDVANRARALVDSFGRRSDIQIEPVVLPSDELQVENLQGTLSPDSSPDEATSREFKLRVRWKFYSKERIENLL